ncbi:E3 ubiquitin-protein ligase TRIM65-like isoform X2 [Paramormyrops kingsleyae]|uniref:E3 ubiquitin-protein ligase TRIM65-like isoform X2 n=1 Tax=Paramormyrops kingsleyae TaxID=1676925 RepID=UPI003B9773FD
MSQNLCCSICLDQFKVPVTIPCGHTFCQKCITVHWDKMTEANMDIKCPICNEKFDPRPTLKRNVTLSDVTETIQLGTESQGATTVHRQSAMTAQAQEGLKKKSREVDKIKEDTEKKVQELSENINKTKVSLKQTSLWVNAKFASLVKVLAEKQESILSFIEQEQQLALSEAETNLSALEDRVQQLGEIQGQIATLQAMTDIQLIQESRLVEVPQMKDIALDVPTNLQGRLSLITDVLSQISKLVSEDLAKAVNAAIGQDKQGVFYTGNELTLGAFSTRYLYIRHLSIEAINLSRFQTLHHSQDQRAFQGCQGQDCGPTQGWIGLQDHRQAAG